MNIQVERLENHKAQLTVVVDSERWDAALKKTAKELSNRYRIPGFRKGKAPYNIVKRYLGEAAIVEDTIEKLGAEIYPEALDQSQVQPYAAGSFDDFKLDPEPTYIFSVPLQPEAELGDYRSVRKDWEEPVVSDEDVDETLQQLREQKAEVEESDEPAQLTDRLTVDVHSYFADGEEPVDEEEAETDDSEADAEEDTDDAEEEFVPKKGDSFFHRHDFEIALTHDTEPLLPGFTDAMLGAVVDEEREFELTVPDDDPEYETIAGRKVHFHVTVKKLQKVTLPDLDDAFAASLTENDGEPLNLVQLRERIHENMQREAKNQAQDAYANELLDEMVEGATVSYPEAMVDERIHQMIDEFGANLQQQGIDLEMYQNITGTTHEDFHEQYHDSAVQSVKRSIVLGEVMLHEKIRVSEAEIDFEIDALLQQFGPSAESLREYISQPSQRADIANRLLYHAVMERIALIGRGEAPTMEEIEAEIEAAAKAADQPAVEEDPAGEVGDAAQVSAGAEPAATTETQEDAAAEAETDPAADEPDKSE